MIITGKWVTIAYLDCKIVIRQHASENGMREYIGALGNGPVTVISPSYEIEISELTPKQEREKRINNLKDKHLIP